MSACDTGFFVEYLNANSRAAEVFAAARAHHQKLVVSVISLFELRRLALKGVIEQKHRETYSASAQCVPHYLPELAVTNFWSEPPALRTATVCRWRTALS